LPAVGGSGREIQRERLILFERALDSTLNRSVFQSGWGSPTWHWSRDTYFIKLMVEQGLVFRFCLRGLCETRWPGRLSCLPDFEHRLQQSVSMLSLEGSVLAGSRIL
jgi:hypothetical protein